MIDPYLNIDATVKELVELEGITDPDAIAWFKAKLLRSAKYRKLIDEYLAAGRLEGKSARKAELLQAIRALRAERAGQRTKDMNKSWKPGEYVSHRREELAREKARALEARSENIGHWAPEQPGPRPRAAAAVDRNTLQGWEKEIMRKDAGFEEVIVTMCQRGWMSQHFLADPSSDSARAMAISVLHLMLGDSNTLDIVTGAKSAYTYRQGSDGRYHYE